jgi:predicted alpha/beta superfamily hydrolase
MQDGQNLFEGQDAFVKGEYWRLGETADAEIAAGRVNALIIVGVHHTGPKRVTEYTPTETKRLGGGLADAYGRLLVDEVKPFIDRTYRTLADEAYTGLGGSSMGGLVSLYLGLKYPAVFSRLAVLSPSVWWDRRVILRHVRDAKPKPPLRIWLDMGTAEGPKALEDVRLLKAGLLRAGWIEGEDLAYSEHEGARHAETAWATRVGPMLRYLYPAPARRQALRRRLEGPA